MGLFDVVKKVGGAIVNPIGTVAGALGAPKGVQAALNPVGAVAQAATGTGGPIGGMMGDLGGGGHQAVRTDLGTSGAARMKNGQALQQQAGQTSQALLASAGANPYASQNVASASGGQTLQSGYTVPAGSRGMPSTAAGAPSNSLAGRIAPGQAPTASAMGYNVNPAATAAFKGGGSSFQATPQPTQQSAPGAFQIGGGPAGVAGQLGARPSVGPQPGNVAGQLGAAPQAGSVGNVAGQLGGYMGSTAGALGAAPGGIAGQLGAAPGSFSMGAAPGGINGQRSGYGAQNAAQGEMLSRLSGFLDGPEGPSVAQAQLQQSSADNMAQLIGAARSGRGGAGATAEAMRGALSEGGAMMADTAGQMATLRAQEEDMRRNRQLSAIGLGGDMANAQRTGDLAFGAQELSALQGDQATALGARGQDLQGNIANQQAGLTARGQNLSALQGDHATALGARGQNLQGLLGDQSASIAARGQDLSALQGDQGTQLGLQQLQGQLALGARGQDLSALQGDQSTGLGYQQLAAQTALTGRGQDLSALQGDQSTRLGARGQDLTAMMGDADRNLSAQQLNLQRELGLTNAGLTASGQQLSAAGMGNDLYLGQQAADARFEELANMPTWQQQLMISAAGGAANAAGGGAMKLLTSDERAKEGIRSASSELSRHLDVSPGYGYRYKPGTPGEDAELDHAGPMAQDLEKSPFGASLVKTGHDGIKRVDPARLAMVDHAALVEVKSQLDSLRRFVEGKAA